MLHLVPPFENFLLLLLLCCIKYSVPLADARDEVASSWFLTAIDGRRCRVMKLLAPGDEQSLRRAEKVQRSVEVLGCTADTSEFRCSSSRPNRVGLGEAMQGYVVALVAQEVWLGFGSMGKATTETEVTDDICSRHVNY